MHFHVEVVVPRADGPEAAWAEAERILAQHVGESTEGRDYPFDWYQLGARWRGAHMVGNAAPIRGDIAYEVCDLCQGTGERPDMVVENGCNGCRGEGKRLPWSTQWGPHPSDVCRAEDVTPGLTAFAVVHPEGIDLQTDYSKPLPEVERDPIVVPIVPGAWYVTVDCHG